MRLQLVPVQLSDIDDSSMNPVRRYMANRVAEECSVDGFWVDSGLFLPGGVIIMEHPDGTAQHQALCYEDSIEHPSDAPPAQSVLFTVTQERTETVTRTFGLQLTLTRTLTHAILPQAQATEYASATTTVTEWTTQVFSVPTMVVHGGAVHWTTTTERQLVVETETLGQATVTTSRTVTVTTSVIAVLDQQLTLTTTTRCPDSVRQMLPFTELPSSEPTATTWDTATTAVVRRRLLCNRFASPPDISICDRYDESDTDLLLVTSPVSFMDADCVCHALGMRLADLSTGRQKDAARRILRACSDLPSPAAWVDRMGSAPGRPVEVCMAVGRSSSSDGPIACVQELPVFCSE